MERLRLVSLGIAVVGLGAFGRHDNSATFDVVVAAYRMANRPVEVTISAPSGALRVAGQQAPLTVPARITTPARLELTLDSGDVLFQSPSDSIWVRVEAWNRGRMISGSGSCLKLGFDSKRISMDGVPCVRKSTVPVSPNPKGG